MESKKLQELRIKCKKASERLKKTCYECSPLRRKSEFVTCHNCGSRYPKKYLFGSDDDFAYCLICGDIHSFYSATSIKRIENCKRKVEDIQKLIEEEQRREREAHPNWLSDAARQSISEAYSNFDFVDDEYDLGDAIEVCGEIDGQSVHYVIVNYHRLKSVACSSQA